MPTFDPALDLPSPTDMTYALRARLAGFDAIDWTAETGSTNTDLLTRLRNQTAPAGTLLCGTHLQQAGRGRAGRRFEASSALMFSCAFPVRMAPVHLPSLSPVIGAVACEVLRRHASTELAGSLGVKWPNDIQLGSAKLAGILIESVRDTAAGPDVYVIVVGMGTNLRGSAALSQSLGRAIADWSQASPATPLPELVAELAETWRTALQCCADHGFAAFQTRYRAVDILYGQSVNVISDGRTLHSGIAQGTDDFGRLLIDEQQGNAPAAISVGEISIRTQQP